jgi:hypothetical protein
MDEMRRGVGADDPTRLTPHVELTSEIRRRARWAGVLCLLLPIAGCHDLGPDSISRGRAEYASSISESWKRQTLLNIVKLRYLDPPVFVDVGQIVAGYSLETTINAAGSFPDNPAFGGNTATVGGAARYTDRPTITYTPLTGNRFVKSLMTPLPPESVFFTIQAGWPADAVLFATVASMNGLKNQENSVAGITPPEPKFLRVLALMRKLQQSGAVGMRVQSDPEKKQPQQAVLLAFKTSASTPETREESRELRELLGLDQQAAEFKLVFGATAAHDKEVAVLTRSIVQLMQTMATQVQVPPADVEQGRVAPGWELLGDGDDASGPRLVRIYSSRQRPADAFVSVGYRGQWFWIDDRDLPSKRAFATMLLLFTLADTGEPAALPLVTIPAQ